MPKKNYCPILKGNCKQKECEWWADGAGRCTVALIPSGLAEIFNIIDAKQFQ